MSSPVKVVNQKGENGGQHLNVGGQSHVGDIDAIFAHDDSIVGVLSNNIQGTLSGVPIPKGAYWVGRFSTVTLVSGRVTTYLKV